MSDTPTNAKAPTSWKIPLTTLIVNDDAPECQNKIHVIEASYAKELEAEIERLKHSRDLVYKESDRRLFEWNKAQGETSKRDATIASLTEKLAVAVAALEGLQKYVAYNGDDWVRLEASEALASIRGKNG